MSEDVKNTQPEPLIIKASREDREYAFSFPEGVKFSEIADVLQQMRDHVMYMGRIEEQKMALSKAKEKNEAESTNEA